jgi:hypothetical protein
LPEGFGEFAIQRLGVPIGAAERQGIIQVNQAPFQSEASVGGSDMAGPIMKSSIHWNAALIGLGLAALLPREPASAADSLLGVQVRLPTCATATGRDGTCVDSGFLQQTVVGANSTFIGVPNIPGTKTRATFTSAFNAANTGWTLVNGGTLNLTINVDIGVSAASAGGGLNPVLFTLSGGTPQVLNTLDWTQALFVNYSPLTGSLPQPIETLDTFSLSQDTAGSNPDFPKACSPASSGPSPSGGAFCGPIYPFQYGTELQHDVLNNVPLGVDPFFDAPEGDWPDATFWAITLLSTVNPATHTLTVYQGVAYGFALTARGPLTGSNGSVITAALVTPEPPVWALMIVALPALYLMRRRTASSAIVACGSTAA